MTYEYVCSSCDHEWEAEQPISAAPLKKCPKCGKNTAKRQISGGAGFILKGGGWYADGYASSRGGKSPDKPSGSGSSGSGNGGSSSGAGEASGGSSGTGEAKDKSAKPKKKDKQAAA